MSEFAGPGEAVARQLDAADRVGHMRSRFFIPPGTVYMNGNSLGLLCRDAEERVLGVLDRWRSAAIGGWTGDPDPWWTMAERLGERLAPVVGARPSEVVMTGTTTVNIHALVSALYRPRGERRLMLATELDFPSDIYALRGQLILRHGREGESLLVKAPSRDGHVVEEDDIIDQMTGAVALALLPSVLYRSGQLLDMERLAAVARERGIIIGFDCSHSVGAVPHRLSDWGVDFAVWCHYKYMNGGPGAVAGLYVNQRHRDVEPPLAGWWGYVKERQFDMVHDFRAQPGARGFQISSPGILSAAPVEGALAVLEEMGLDRARQRSLALTEYLMFLADRLGEGLGLVVVTPRRSSRRGGHVALAHPRAGEITGLLARRGIVADFRQPDVIRVTPSPFYSTYHDVWTVVNTVADAVRSLT